MEKYRKFADPASSCNPFLPLQLQKPLHQGSLGSVACLVANIVLILIRIPLYFVLGILLCVQDALSLLPIVSRLLIIRSVRPLVSWLILICFGLFSPLSAKREDFRKLQVKRPDGKDNSWACAVSTFHGFIDVFVHAVIMKPESFIFLALDGTRIQCRTIIGAISVALKSPLASSCDLLLPLPDRSVLFVSPSPTNGLGVLRLDAPSISIALSGLPIQVCALNYACVGRYYPHHLTESTTSHLLKLVLLNWFCSVQLSILPEPIVFKSFEDIPKLKTLMARLAIPAAAETDIDPKLYLEFLAYWKETQSVDYGAIKMRK